MPDNSAAIVIDIGTTNCKVTCFSCLDATTLGAHKFVTAKQISPQGNVDFDIDALWQEVRQAIAQLNAASPLPVRRPALATCAGSTALAADRRTAHGYHLSQPHAVS